MSKKKKKVMICAHPCCTLLQNLNNIIKKICKSVYYMCNRNAYTSFLIKKIYHKLSLINFHNSTLFIQQTKKTNYFLLLLYLSHHPLFP